ncbi:MAG: NAD-glutamate dehydrogenase [bacterium]|nr:NAD-glutamate dehydrogenase [bacterium]
MEAPVMSETPDSLFDFVYSLLPKNTAGSERENLKTFLDIYKAQSHEQNRLTQEDKATLLASLWQLIRTREEGQAKFRVYRWGPKGEGAASERLVIDIVNDNMAFLVDSLTGLLGRYDLKAHVLDHPVIGVKRDTKGFLEELNQKEGDQEGRFDSVIHCEITEGFTPEIVERLEAELPRVLSDVRFATGDWREMRARVSDVLSELESVPKKTEEKQGLTEVRAFLEWLEDHHFTFLGYCGYEFPGIGADKKVTNEMLSREPLGVLRSERMQDLNVLFEGVPSAAEARRYLLQPQPLLINKTTQVSLVHRSVPMDAVGVKRFDKEGRVVGLHLFVGLLTSEAYDSSVRDVPLLRRKVYEIAERSGVSPEWHDGKALIHILDSLPRDELFQASVDELLQIGQKILSIRERQRVAFFVRRDRFNRFLSCLVYVPKDRFSFTLGFQMRNILEEELGCPVTLLKAQFGDFAFARAHYRADIPAGSSLEYDQEEIERRLVIAARSWRDGLRVAFNEELDEVKSARYLSRYGEAFPSNYQEEFSAHGALQDINLIDQVLSSSSCQADVYREEGMEPSCIKLKLYNLGKPLPLSDALPMLENFGLRVISETPYRVSPEGERYPVWIHDFEVLHEHGGATDLNIAKTKLLEAVQKIWAEEAEDDGFNRLILHGHLSWRQCVLFRAYGRYLHQLDVPFSRDYVEDVLTRNGEVARLLARLFELRFSPDIAKSEGSATLEQVEKAIRSVLVRIKSADEDRILSHFLNLVSSTVRTNFYQKSEEGNLKSYVSFKIDSRKVEGMPLPKPLYEIFVYASYMEAVHLRGGKIARGGLRWSDRLEDYRTEVLGLMKAQMVKNTVIVPVGSKGGFVVKRSLEGLSRQERHEEVIACYKTMIQGLLDITDNRVGGKICPPAQVKRYDDDDPYLVVAADKGTATFSDYANSVSNAYGFWLGDAFASGGSVGYDHKKMGITAKGAWESVKHHFAGLDVDVAKDPITVVGIGDMSGDVFGNGLLMSESIKLVAAFNHMHIFLDPNPDMEKSFKERQRLFKMARSQWTDYNATLLSEGGVIFERSAKSLTLTPQIQSLLNIDQQEISPNNLIQEILKTPIDLIWFGGIGTYVKSKQESQADVGDRANDRVRVNAVDLRCRVIGEGANLGLTQQSRIELARQGCRLNTDAIDNSAGVDCSDHEVNLKILLGSLVDSGELSLEQRNHLLESMTDEVAHLVLRDNQLQNQAISLVEEQSVKLLDVETHMMQELERQGLLNRDLEFLPDDAALETLQDAQKGLTRPEVSVLLSYGKLHLYDQIVQSSLLKESYFEKLLKGYFPKSIQAHYEATILSHPLRQEIIATLVTNTLINSMGPGFVVEMEDKTGRSSEDVARAYLVVREIFDLKDIWAKFEDYGSVLKGKDRMELLQTIWQLTRQAILWMLRSYPGSLDLVKTTNKFVQGMRSLAPCLRECLDSYTTKRLQGNIDHLRHLGLENDFAERVAILGIMASFPDIILIADETRRSVKDAASVYFALGERFGFSELRQSVELMKSHSSWHRAALSALVEDLFSYQGDAAKSVLEYGQEFPSCAEGDSQECISFWCDARRDRVTRIEKMLGDVLRGGGNPDLAYLTVVIRELRSLVKHAE